MSSSSGDGVTLSLRATVDADAFWAKVAKSEACWRWTASTTARGRGQFRVGRRMCQAHRVAWALINGEPIPEFLRNRCGDPACVRPDHQQPMVGRGDWPPKRGPGQRFDAMVVLDGDCHIWTGATMAGGYGEFRLGEPGRPMVVVHRYAFERAYGSIPSGHIVYQTCGNCRCVRPEHLDTRPRTRPALATPAQKTALIAWLKAGGRYGAGRLAATELGLTTQTLADHLYALRRRLGVATTAEAAKALDEREPGWRASDPRMSEAASRPHPR